MYKYIDVDVQLLRKRLSPRSVYVWIPVQLIRFAECRPKETYIVDCFFRSTIDNPYASIAFLRKIPNHKKMRMLSTPPIKAKELESECKDIVGDLNQVVSDVVSGTYERLYQLMEEIYEYKDVEFTVRYFMRAKKYVIKGERIREISRSIALRTIEGLVNRLCLYDRKEKKVLNTPISTEKCYALVYVDPLLQASGIAIGKKLIDISTYIRVIRRLNMEHMFALEFQEISPSTRRQMQQQGSP